MEQTISNKEWRKKSMTWGKRLLLAVLILGGAVYAVLTLAVRSKDAIRQGLEDAIEQASGEDAEITDIISVSLAPDVMFRVRGGVLRDAETRKISLMKVEKVYLSMPLWRLMVGSNWYHGFELQGVEIASGYFLPKKVTFDYAGISDPSGGKEAPQLLMEGRYNNQDLLITAEMARKDKKIPLYGFRHIFPVTFKLGILQGHGFYERAWDSINLKDIILTRGDKSAKFSIENFEKDPVRGDVQGTLDDVAFTGKFESKEEKTVLSLSPENENEKFRIFVASVLEDIGFTEENTPFTIEIKDVTKESDTK